MSLYPMMNILSFAPILGGTLNTGLVFVLSFILFLAPGICLYRLFYPQSSLSELITMGFPIGLGVSALLCALVAWVINFNPLLCALFIVICAATLWMVGKKYQNRSQFLNVQNEHMSKLLLYFSALTAILIIISYSSFGVKTSQGYAYKDLYATDLLHHMSVFIHLPKGIPPVNPYFSGESWHYYWISHILPAFIYVISGFSLLPKNIMLLISISYALMFLSLFFFLIRHYFEDKEVIIMLMILSLFAYGYNDLFVIFKYFVLMLPMSIIQQFHLEYFISDAHGEQFTGYSHGWFRNFLIEPHSTLAISILFVVILLVKREGVLPSEPRRNSLRGILLGMIFSIDAFIGLIAICWYILATLKESLNRKIPIGNLIYYTIWMFLPIGVVFLFLYAVNIISPGSNHLILKPDFRMIALSPIYYLIDYGPAGFLGAAGIYLLKRNKELDQYESYLVLVATCLFFMFFVNVSPVGSTQMFRKAGAVIRIPLLLFSGICLRYLINNSRSKGLISITLLSMVFAIPTPFIDMYRLSDWKAGASFVKQQDMAAQQWIKESLPSDSVIQDFPMTITPIVAFGERRVAIGDWEHARTGGLTTEKVSEVFQEIRKLFETDDPNAALITARKFSINYIYVNTDAREKFLTGSQKFDARPDLFEKVYDQDGVSIYKVIGT